MHALFYLASMVLVAAQIPPAPTMYPTVDPVEFAKSQQDFRAGMLSVWLPLAASFGALFWLFIAGFVGGKATGTGLWLQGLAVLSMVFAWFFLLTPFWPAAVWMLFTGAAVVFCASHPRYQYFMMALVIFNTVCYLGFASNFWFNVSVGGPSLNLLDNILQANYATQEQDCVDYYNWYNGPFSDPANPAGTGQCRNIEYKSWVIFTMIFQVVFIYPTMSLMSIVVVESNTPPPKPSADSARMES